MAGCIYQSACLGHGGARGAGAERGELRCELRGDPCVPTALHQLSAALLLRDHLLALVPGSLALQAEAQLEIEPKLESGSSRAVHQEQPINSSLSRVVHRDQCIESCASRADHQELNQALSTRV